MRYFGLNAIPMVSIVQKNCLEAVTHFNFFKNFNNIFFSRPKCQKSIKILKININLHLILSIDKTTGRKKYKAVSKREKKCSSSSSNNHRVKYIPPLTPVILPRETKYIP